ncbi:MAG: hypothetical protein FWC85_00340 [Elusimicrobia bacterium]|nr:hypothetical protein [Elusimicrobiota bacterium]
MLKLDNSFVWKLIFKIAALNLTFLVAMTLFRAAFFFYFGGDVGFADAGIARVFALGMRYDISVLGYINIPVVCVVALLIFVNLLDIFLLGVRFLKYYYTLLVGSALSLTFANFFVYAKYQKHLSDWNELHSAVINNFNVFLAPLLGAIIFWAVFATARKVLIFQEKRAFRSSLNKFAALVIMVFWISGCFVLARGSLGGQALSSRAAQEVSDNAFMGDVAVSGVFILGESIIGNIRGVR